MTEVIFEQDRRRHTEEVDPGVPVTVVVGDVRVIVGTEGVSLERFDPNDEDKRTLDENWFVFNDVLRDAADLP